MHWSLSLHAQEVGSWWPAQSRVPSKLWGNSSGTLNNQCPAEHLLKITKSLSKMIFVAQNCPFLLLFAPLLPIKESVGPYQNSV